MYFVFLRFWHVATFDRTQYTTLAKNNQRTVTGVKREDNNIKNGKKNTGAARQQQQTATKN